MTSRDIGCPARRESKRIIPRLRETVFESNNQVEPGT
jgi:hypothetical protein